MSNMRVRVRRPIKYHLRMFDGLAERVADLRRSDYRAGIRLLMDVYGVGHELLSDAAKVAVTMTILGKFKTMGKSQKEK